MSDTYELATKVVQMEFDNKDFEKNIGETINSLGKFEHLLDRLVEVGASGFFGALGNSLAKVMHDDFRLSLGNVSTGIQDVRIQFDTLGIVGKRVLENLTDAALHFASAGIGAVFNKIKEGGLRRAMNIEDAKFRLQGLGIAWKQISDDIDYGVDKTAYGLDQSAKAASVLAASGVKFGGVYKEGAKQVSDMGQALRAISGVAAMGNIEYERAASIFEAVAARGKLMQMQLQQFASFGLSGSAAIVKFFNQVNEGSIEASEQVSKDIKELTKGLSITEMDLNDFIQKGKINFKMFSEAMDSAFGEHAADANKTLTGTLSNINAALSRIGALFFSPLIEQEGPLVKLLNTVREKINDIKKAVTPFAEVLTERINEIILAVNYLISKLDFTKELDGNAIRQIINSVIIFAIKAFNNLYKVILVVRKAFMDVFPYDFVNVGKAIIVILYELFSSFKIEEGLLNNIYTISYAIFNLLKMGIKILVSLVNVLSPLVRVIFNIVSLLGKSVLSLATWISGLKVVNKVIDETSEHFFLFEKVANMLKKAKSIIEQFFNVVFHSSAKKDQLGEIAKKSATPFELLSNILTGLINKYQELKAITKPIHDDLLKFFDTKFASATAAAGGGIISIIMLIKFLTTTVRDVKKKTQELVLFDPKVGILGKILGNDMYKRIDGVLNSVRKSFDQFTRGLQLENLKKIAISIAILSASLLMLSFIPSDKIAGSLIMMGAAFAALYAEFEGFANITKDLDASKMLRLVPIILAMSVALAVMTGAIMLLSGTLMLLSLPKITDLIFPLIAIIGLMAALWAAVGTLTKAADDYYSPSTFKNLIAMTAMMAILGAAVTSLGLTASIMSLVPWDKLLVSFGVMTLTMVAIMAVVQHLIEMTRIADIGTTISSVLLIGAMCLAIKSVSGSMILIAMLPWERVALGFLGLIGTLVAMALVVEALGKMEAAKSKVGALKVMLKIAGSIWVFAKAMKVLSKVDVIGALPGLTAFAAILTILTIVAEPLAAAMATLSEAIGVIAAIGAVLGLYAVVFAGFGAAAELFALSIYKVVETFILLGSIGPEQLENILQNVVYFTGALEYIGIALVNTITNIVVKMREQLITLGKTLLHIVIALTPVIKQAVTALAVAVSVGMLNAAPIIATAVGTAFVLIAKLLTDNMDLLARTTVALITTYWDAVRAYFPVLSNSLIELLIDLFNSVIATISTNMPIIVRTVLVGLITIMKTYAVNFAALMATFLTEILGLSPKFMTAGLHIMQGLIQGLTNGIQMVYKIITGLANGIIKIFTFILGIHSPSEVFHKFGIYLGEGLESGIDAIYGKVVKKAGELGSGVKDATEDGMEGIDLGSLGSKFDDLFGGIINGATNAADAIDLLFARFGAYSASVSNLDKMTSNFSKDSNKAKGGGYQALEAQKKGTLKSYRNTKSEGFGNPFDNLSKSITDSTNALGEFGGAAGKAGKGAKGAAKDVDSLTESFKSMEELQSSLQEKIKGSIDIFSEFSHESDLSADKLLSNMRSQVEGVKEWSKNLQTLGARGIEKGLLQKLAELGPQGWDKVQAFVQMTDDQLKEANSLFAQSLMLPESESSKIVSSFAQNGMWAAQGLIDGIPVNAIYDVGMTMGTALDDGTKAALGIHSPSQVMFDNAVNIGQGVINGIIYMIGKIQPLGAQMGRAIITGFNSAMGKATMFNVGKSVVNSFAIAFTKTKVINEAIKAFCDNIRVAIEKGLLDTHYIEIAELMMDNIILGYQNGVTKFIAEIDLQNKTISDKMYEAFEEIGTYCAEGLKDGLENSIEEVAKATIKMCKASIKSAHEEFDSNSPSKVFEELGKFIGIGLANGIKNSTGNAVSATTSMADSTISKFQTALNRVHDYVQNGMDDNLTITPVLDLSNVESGLNNMNSMMGSKRLNLSTTLDNASRIAAAFNGSASGVIGPKNNTVQNNYTFNQTNTSPKALSNAEIYRQTNNLINRYRSDIGYA